MDYGLPSEGLPSQYQDQAQVGHASSPHQRELIARTQEGKNTFPPGQQPTEERQHLQGVQADEMSNSQVATHGAPSQHRQTGAAIRDSDAVRPDNVWTVSAGDSSRSLRPGSHHEERCRHSDRRDEQSQSQRPCKGAVRHPLEQQRNCKQEVHYPNEDDEGSHREPKSGIEWRGLIEVAGCPARRLREDDYHLYDQAGACDIGHQTNQARPVLDKAEHPDESEAINTDRDGKLGRFEPRGRSRDDPMVYEDAR
jgi:hypothetical protein